MTSAKGMATVAALATVATMALAVLAPSVAAQRITGRVTVADSVTAAPGAIVEARLPGARTGHRASASSTGSFVLMLPDSGRYELTVLRVGHRPTRLGARRVGRGETVREEIVLAPAPIAIGALRVESERVCGPRALSGEYVATLIDQARAVMAASVVRAADPEVEVRWSNFWVVTDRQATPMTPLRVERHAAASQSPFASVAADRLATEGYVVRDDGGDEYRAPDADVLLSDEFIANNCFELVTGRGARADAIGVRFSPIGGGTSAFVRVAGTLWFDRATATLQRLEFGYAGIAPELEEAGAGGTIDFVRLDGGGWSVRQWQLRMPRRLSRTDPSGVVANDSIDVFAVTRVGGMLEEVRVADRIAFVATEPLPDLLDEVSARAQEIASCEAGPVRPAQRRGHLYGMLYDADSVPVRQGAVYAKWRLGGARRDVNGTVAFPVRDGFYQFCGFPFGTLVVLTAGAVGSGETTINLRITEKQSSGPMHITLPPPKP